MAGSAATRPRVELPYLASLIPQPRSRIAPNYAARFAALRKTVVPLLTIFVNSPAKK